MHWRVGGASVRGVRHERAGRPNQDAFATREDAPQAIAVADGHGDPRCTRAEIGSAFAVDVAIETARSFSADHLGGEPLRAMLADAIVGGWIGRVEHHLALHPFSSTEVAMLGPDPPLYAYGTTLLAAFAVDDTVYAVQIGDGDLLVSDGGVRRVFERDPRLVFHQTTSLAQADARAELRATRLGLSGDVLLLAATDGYANSFDSDAGFTRIASDFAHLIGEHGLHGVVERLPAMLDATSRVGSGDDITIGLLATITRGSDIA